MVFEAVLQDIATDMFQRDPHDSGTVSVFYLFIVCLISYSLFALRIHQGYHPVDDPLQAHVAERVLQGDLPNVDIHDVYTGGLAYLQALSLKMFGVRLLSLRILLFLFFAAWVPNMWFIFCRIARPVAASLLTLLAVVWSVPIYPSPLGSWYNLFFATFSIGALLRYLDFARTRWLFFAGLLVGFSFLVKISGLYLFVAIGLFFIFLEQRQSERMDGERSLAYSIPLTFLLTSLVLVLIGLILANSNAPEWFHFVLPGSALSLFLVWREWTVPYATGRERFRTIMSLFVPFLSGAVVPVAFFLIPYLCRGDGAFWTLLKGVFVLPTARLRFAVFPPIHPLGALCCLPLLLIWLLDSQLRTRRERATCLLIILSLYALALVASIRHAEFARLIWVSAAAAIPVLSIITVCKVAIDRRDSTSHATLVLLATTSALCSLVQFPLSAPFYFLFVAPLAILVLAGLAVEKRNNGVSLLLPSLIFYLVFMLRLVYVVSDVNGVSTLISPRQAFYYKLAPNPTSDIAFSIDRASGLIGPRTEVGATESACIELLKHAGGNPIYAGPDSPQFYFLTGLRNPTPNVIEALSGEDGKPGNILRNIEANRVNAVVIDHAFHNSSGPMVPELLNVLRARYPSSKSFGQFEVRWKDATTKVSGK